MAKAKKQESVKSEGIAIVTGKPVTAPAKLEANVVRMDFITARVKGREEACAALGKANGTMRDDLRGMLSGEWSESEMYVYLYGDKADSTYTAAFLNNGRVALRDEAFLKSVGRLEYDGTGDAKTVRALTFTRATTAVKSKRVAIEPAKARATKGTDKRKEEPKGAQIAAAAGTAAAEPVGKVAIEQAGKAWAAAVSAPELNPALRHTAVAGMFGLLIQVGGFKSIAEFISLAQNTANLHAAKFAA